MKIWYQTMTTYRYNPLWDKYGKSMEEQCRRAARPDTEIYVTGVPASVHEVDQYKSLMLYNYAGQGLNNMLRAEREGYDAVVNVCSFDPGLDEAREMLNIPVVGITQTSLYMAAILGELFAIVTCEPYLYERYRQLIVRYGLQQKFLRGNYIFPITEVELAKAIEEPEPIAVKVKAIAEKAVADGASVVIPLPVLLSQVLYKTGCPTYLNGALVLDPIAVATKFAEFLVDLKKIGIGVSRTLQVYGSPGKELLKKAFETFSPVFKIEY